MNEIEIAWAEAVRAEEEKQPWKIGNDETAAWGLRCVSATKEAVTVGYYFSDDDGGITVLGAQKSWPNLIGIDEGFTHFN